MAGCVHRVFILGLLSLTLVKTRELSESCASLLCQRKSSDDLAICRHELHLGQQGQYVHYYSSIGSLAAGAQHPEVTDLTVILHGINSNADTYFKTMTKVVAKAGACNTAVVAPEWRARSSDVSLLVWSGGSWLQGQAASNDAAVFSFTVLDCLVSLAQSAFPNLGTVTFVGHSAGAQALQRYAGANHLSIPASYILANAGTYMYLTDQRVSTGALLSLNRTCPSLPGSAVCSLSAADFSQPWNGAPSCPGYNEGKYGLGDLAGAYLARAGAAYITSTYPSRKVVYLLGDSDALDNAHLDQSCEANAQGSFRLQRGLVFFEYLNLNFNGITSLQQAVIVPGCGHNESCMLDSAQFCSAWGSTT